LRRRRRVVQQDDHPLARGGRPEHGGLLGDRQRYPFGGNAEGAKKTLGYVAWVRGAGRIMSAKVGEQSTALVTVAVGVQPVGGESGLAEAARRHDDHDSEPTGRIGVSRETV
jgi:hypothetical protein